MTRQYLAALLLASSPIWAGATTVTGPNLVQNGSFESYAVNDGGYATFGSSNGWTTGQYGVEIRNNVAGTASDGVKYAELDTTRNSYISQSIYLAAGQTYLLSFDYSNRSGTSVSSNGLSWSLGSAGGAVAALAYNDTGNNVWSTFSTIVTATTTGWTTLKFSALGTSDSYGSSLDNISLATAAVPEPASFALFLAGLGALGLASRRRKLS